MRTVISKIRAKNFLSIGNEFLELDMTAVDLTLFVGENGSGKSTFLDILWFVFFNRPYRKINKPQLVNTIIRKGTVGEVECTCRGHSYLIRRGIKPALFEIVKDGELLDQKAGPKDDQEWLEGLLGVSAKTLGQIGVIGSAIHVPFMQLPTGQRREIIDDLLDVKLCTVMNSLLKDRVSTARRELDSAEADIRAAQGKLEVNKRHVEAARAQNEERIAELGMRIGNLRSTISESLEREKVLNAELLEVDESAKDLYPESELRRRANECRNAQSVALNNLNRLRKSAEFYQKNDACPTCFQELGPDHKAKHLDEIKAQARDFVADNESAKTQLAEVEGELRLWEEIEMQRASVRHSIRMVGDVVKQGLRSIADLEAEVKRLQNKPEVADMSQELQEELRRAELVESGVHRRFRVLEAAGMLLKDGGIKAKMVKQYVPVINQLVNKYLAKMDFMVQFEFDENFKEKLLSRYRDDFSYESFSEGQKKRIDLALMFTWREIAKSRNSASTNLMVFDEVLDSSLDLSGMDDFLKIIREDSENVVVISHRGDQLVDKFDRVLKFTLRKNFTHVEAI